MTEAGDACYSAKHEPASGLTRRAACGIFGLAMKGSDNPFFNRGPILDAAHFFGRRDEIADILGLVANMQNCSVVGGVKRGKTSVLLHLQREQTLRDHRCDLSRCCLPYLSLEGLANITPEAFFHDLLREALRCPHSPAVTDAHERLSPVGEISFSELQATLDDFARAGVNVVFLLDEFELAGENPHFDPNLFSALRSLASRPNCAFVVATTDRLDRLRLADRDVGSPFADLFTAIRLNKFTRAAVSEMVAALSERAGRLWEVSLDHIMDWTDGAPYLVQIACSLLWKRARGGGRRLTAADYDYVREGFLTQAEAVAYHVWRRMTPAQKGVMLAVAAGRSERVDREDEATHDLLQTQLLVERNGELMLPDLLTRTFLQARLREQERGAADFLVADRADTAYTADVAAPADKRIIYKAVRALVKAAEARDHFTRGHSDGCARLAVAIAVKLNLATEEIEGLKIAARLHDIGKIGVSDLILLKPDSLTDQERELVRAHVLVSAHILEALDFPWEVKPTVRFHHERLDGSGYPDGLMGDEIPLPARVLAVADVFDAMTSPRSHRPAHPRQAAIAEITANAGVKYDPQVVAALVKVIEGSGT